MNADDERLTALKEQVKQRRHAMLDAARAGGGVVDAQQWEELERLQRLVDLEAASGSARAARRRTRTAQLLLAGVVALVVLTLLLLRLPTARVGLQVQATEARMILEQQTALLPAFPVRWLMTEGHSAVTITRADGTAQTLGEPVLRIESVAQEVTEVRTARPQPRSTVPAQVQPARLTVRLPTIPIHAGVGLEAAFGDGSVGITLCGAEQPVALKVVGGARISTSPPLTIAPGEAARIFVAPPALMTSGEDSSRAAVPPADRQGDASPVRPCPPDRELRLRFQPSGDSLALQPDLPVRDLQLFRQVLSSTGVPEPQSTVLGGRLQLLSVKVPPRTLQKHELLEAVHAEGRLRNTELAAGAVSLDFDGQVDDIITGSPYVRESVMPRLLQWFLSQELLLVAWSSGLTTLGVALGLYRWLSTTS